MDIYLARHDETEWSLSGRHTGLSDIPLTPKGELNGAKLGERLRGIQFARVLTSPLKRAFRTCELAGFGAVAKVEPGIVEWDYGQYDGKTTDEILTTYPHWELFEDGCPGGESLDAVAKRADRVVANLKDVLGNILIFSHSHFLRVFATRWLGIDPALARVLYLSTGSLSILGYHHSRNEKVIRLWNDCHHLGK
jgi:probable phosphoglycerate mutase